jgi:hypothetical protein
MNRYIQKFSRGEKKSVAWIFTTEKKHILRKKSRGRSAGERRNPREILKKIEI